MAKKSGIVYNVPSEASWDILGVPYMGETRDYRFFEEMTPAMNQEQLAEVYEKEKPKGNPHPTDAPLTWAIASRTYELRKEFPEQAEQIRALFQQNFRRFPNTLTRVCYNPQGEEDEVIHNYRTSDEYSIIGDIIGPDKKIIKPDSDVSEKLLGTRDIENIQKVSNWVNNISAWIWRLNSKPSQRQERVARFNAYSDRLDLCCLRYPSYRYPAFSGIKN